MERYDAILEQLKKAQSRGMETITNRLDFVVESLEELIQEAKTTVQGALPGSADECLPVEEVMEALEGYRDVAEAERVRADGLEAELAAFADAPGGAPQGMSIELMRALDGARSQSELLKELLPAISDHAARAVVLVLRDGKISAWSGIGFADGEALRNWQGDAAESTAVAKLLEVSRPVRFAPEEDALFSSWLTDKDMPAEILLIPVVLRGKLMGTVYIDQLEGQPWNPETAQTLVAQVCWLFDTLQFRTTEAPSLAEPAVIEPATESAQPEATQNEEEPPAAESFAPEGEPESEEEPAEGDFGAAPEVDEDEITQKSAPVAEETAWEEAPQSEAGTMDAGDTDVDPSATMRVDVSGVDFADSLPEVHVEETAAAESEDTGESFEPDSPVQAEPEAEIVSESFEPEEPAVAEVEIPPETGFEPEAPEEIAAEDTTEAEATSPEPVEMPPAVQMPVVPPEPEDEGDEPEASQSKFLDEPPPVQPVQPPPEEPEREVSEDEAQREEARRFARLLVSEIKLYNEEQVERGRESNDIYRRLKEDIDRSREMFDKRISVDIRENQDYFTDELVRILADGDADMLGM